MIDLCHFISDTFYQEPLTSSLRKLFCFPSDIKFGFSSFWEDFFGPKLNVFAAWQPVRSRRREKTWLASLTRKPQSAQGDFLHRLQIWVSQVIIKLKYKKKILRPNKIFKYAEAKRPWQIFEKTWNSMLTQQSGLTLLRDSTKLCYKRPDSFNLRKRMNNLCIGKFSFRLWLLWDEFISINVLIFFKSAK